MFQLMLQMHHPNAEDTKYASQNSKYASQDSNIVNQNSKYAQYWFTLFCRDATFVANLRNLQAKKCGGVQKMTNTRYASEVLEPLSTEATTVSIEAATYSIAL